MTERTKRIAFTPTDDTLTDLEHISWIVERLCGKGVSKSVLIRRALRCYFEFLGERVSLLRSLSKEVDSDSLYATLIEPEQKRIKAEMKG